MLSFKSALIVLSVTGLAFVASVSVSLAADSAKKNQEPPVVDPDHLGGPPSEALARFRGERRPEPKWKLANGLAETTPGSGLNRKEALLTSKQTGANGRLVGRRAGELTSRVFPKSHHEKDCFFGAISVCGHQYLIKENFKLLLL